MKKEELEEAAEILHVSLEESKKDAIPYDPALQVEQSLSIFLQHRLAKIQEDDEFEDLLKDAIRSRLPEATFNDLMRLLDMHQNNANAGTAGILSPFIPRAGERVPVLDSQQKKKTPEESLAENAPKEILQAFGELNNLLTALKGSSSIKETLRKDLESTS